MHEVRQIIGQNIKARRVELGLSITDVAKASGISKNTIRRIEQSQNNFRCTTMEALAQALDMSLADLIKK